MSTFNKISLQRIISSVSVFSLLVGTAFLTSCEDEIEINAPYDEVTVVIGLLDANDQTHLVKINKLFVGEDNALTLAKDRGQAEYGEDLVAVVKEYDYNALSRDTTETNNSWTLTDTLITNKESGDFFYPEQKVYKFDARLKRPDYANEVYPLYKIEITRPDGEIVSAWTPIVQVPVINGVANIDAVLTNYNAIRTTGVPFMTSTNVNPNVTFNTLFPVNTKGMEMKLSFHWSDVDNNNNVVESRSIELPLGTQTVGTVAKTGTERDERSFKVGGEAFYQAVALATQPINDVPVAVRRPDSANVQIEVWMSGEELQTFIDLNSPSQTLLEEKPAYTNIENGLGVWSSRTHLKAESRINQASMNELLEALKLGLTGDRGFCDNLAPIGSPESCL